MPAEAPLSAADAKAGQAQPTGSAGVALVIDTNVALDLLVFKDPACAGLREALLNHSAIWWATPPMRDELQRVLAYPKLAPRVAYHGCEPAGVLAAMDQWCRYRDPAPRAPVRCSDTDDQMFVDLAVAQAALLLSKDRHIATMRKRLGTHGVRTFRSWAAWLASM